MSLVDCLLLPSVTTHGTAVTRVLRLVGGILRPGIGSTNAPSVVRPKDLDPLPERR